MKNKSTRHKGENTFKFQSFFERVSNIDIDIFHKVGHEYESATEETQSYFYQAIQKWNLLNLTEGYERFKRDVRAHEHVTLPQVLLGKDHIVEVLLKHLNERNVLCLQPILECVVAVARDLQKEFYPHYQQFLQVIIELLNSKDAEQLDWTLTCLAYLFKILWRPMIKNVDQVFKSLLPLLSDNKPEHISSFAAESFAFVARKIRDKSAFLALLLKAVQKNQDSITGCGKLLFEVVKGVDGQFHSCCEQFLSAYFEHLLKQPQNRDTLFAILECVISSAASEIHPQKIKPLWEVLLKNLTHVVDGYSETMRETCVGHLQLILTLIGQMVEFKKGKLIQSHLASLIQHLVRVLSLADLTEQVTITVVQINIALLLCNSISLPQDQASQIIRTALGVESRNALLYFVEHIVPCSLFEMIILPVFLRKCALGNFEDDYVQCLTKVVLAKAPLGQSYSEDPQTKINLDFRDYRGRALELYTSWLEGRQGQRERYFCALVCLPHLEVGNAENKKLRLEKLAENLESLLSEALTSEADKLEWLFWLYVSLDSLAIVQGGNAVIKQQFRRLFEDLLPYAFDVHYLPALKCLSLIFTCLKDCDEAINYGVLRELHAKCAVNFNSPFHQMRLLTAHIYSLFEGLPEFQLDDLTVKPEPFRVFSTIRRVESIEPLVHTYRDQLLELERLKFDKPQGNLCSKTEFAAIPLRYLCGVLYMNFKLLWKPVGEIVETYAHGADSVPFWEVFGRVLKDSAQVHRKHLPNVETLTTSFDALRATFEDSQKIDDKPDFANYRVLLWQAMELFSDVAEARTRDVVPLFLDFVKYEYESGNADATVVGDEDEEEEEEEAELEKKEEGEERSTVLRDEGKLGKKMVVRTLLTKLAVFSKFKSPKSMYREQDLYQVYFALLKHRDADVQKSALDCIMTYKFPHLQPYKDHLYGLADGKHFKRALTAFSVDKDATEILPEHRAGLLPVVLQLAFSKMSVKTGMRTGGKAASQNRRAWVFRFLAGCEEHEMFAFVQMAFSSYAKYLQQDDTNIVNQLDDDEALAPKKLLSKVNLLNVILEQCGGLMKDSVLTYLLKVLFVVAGTVERAFRSREEQTRGQWATLKVVRTSASRTLARFFERFDAYRWTAERIDIVFDLFVWPRLDKLTSEGIHSPTGLLLLLKQWACNPKFNRLLVKHRRGDRNEYPLLHVYKLLTNDKSHITVVNAIYEMTEALLKYQLAEDEAPIEANDTLPMIDEQHRPSKLNYGSRILMAHVQDILLRLRRRLAAKSALNKSELFILCRISELVRDPDDSDSILQLLLPVALKRCGSADEEAVEQQLTTVANLMRNVREPGRHLRNLAPLFGEVKHASCRNLLVGVLSDVAVKNARYEESARVVRELNAYDAKWIDQPDLERRHEAFKTVRTLCAAGPIDAPVGALLVHTLFYTLGNEKELALKDGASEALRALCPALVTQHANDPPALDYVLNGCIFALVKRRMRTVHSGDVELRNECVALLGRLARECPDSHVVLRDLHKYTNAADPEVDFFENLTHLQTRRHARAMLRFGQSLREATVAPNPKTLTQFLLPFATHYLGEEKFAGKNALIDAAIEMVGAICRVLPWHQYEGVLKYTLTTLRRKLDFQKQMVRLIVVILDAFHFDLSKGHVDNDVQVPEKEEEKVDAAAATATEQHDSDDNVEEDVDDDDDDDEEEEEEEDGEEAAAEEEKKVVEKTTVLCKSTATRVIRSIQTVLLPQLHRSLAQLSLYDASHKLNRKKTAAQREDEDLSRVPISLALVKLLQKLPKEILDSNLPKIFLKLGSFLSSNLESVRRVARETFEKIMVGLGPKYLKMLLGEITPLLRRGFQVHVLVFTVHGVLSRLKTAYQPRDMDEVLLTVLDLCQADLFGVLSEEREVIKIVAKTSEAKATKSYDTLQIVAQHVTESCLMDLIMPIKRLLQTAHSYKTVQRAERALTAIALGLVNNEFVSVESLLKFAYGTSAQLIGQLLPPRKRTPTEKEVQDKRKLRQDDCFIIAKLPETRAAYRETSVKSGVDTNAHLLIQFGLRLCLAMLKRDKLKEDRYKPFVDPFVPIFDSCLEAKHVKLCSLTLQCLQWVMKFDLPSTRQLIKSITRHMFALLHKYAAAGLSKGDNFELVSATFKAMAVLVRDVHHYTVDKNELTILLSYVEQDMLDYERQATAFGLLRAILHRKLNVPEIHKVMRKVTELSVTFDSEHVRAQARSVFYQFVMEYPLDKSDLERYLGFYLSQIGYDLQYGRESAIEVIQHLINSFPMPVLRENSGLFLIALGTRLINEPVPDCRETVANCLVAMLAKLQKADRSGLFEMLTVWLKGKNVLHRRMAAQLCELFVRVEKADFESRFPIILPLILKQLGSVGGDKSAKTAAATQDFDASENDIPEDVLHQQDHHYFVVLQLVLQIAENCPNFTKSAKSKRTLDNLAYRAQAFLAYPYDLVRASAAKVLGVVLMTRDAAKVADLLAQQQQQQQKKPDERDETTEQEEGYLYSNPDRTIRSLALDLCDQLQSDNRPDLIKQTIKNLVIVARMLQKVPNDAKGRTNLLWLVKRVRKAINEEVIEKDASTSVRTEAFTWIGAVATVLPPDNVRPILHHLVAPLVREMVTDKADATLVEYAKEVAKLLKKTFGQAEYTNTLNVVERNLLRKRGETKRNRAQLAVTDPQGFARKKQRLHEKKKVAKKRKLEEIRGKKSSLAKRRRRNTDED